MLSFLYGPTLTFVHNLPGGSGGKASAYNAGDLGLIPGLGRSSGEGNGNSLQYSCLENPTDGGVWYATVHGVAKSQTQLSDFTFTGKIISLTLQTFVGKVMSLLFNILSSFVIAFLSRSKHLLISWLQSPSAVSLEPKIITSVTASTFSPSVCHEVIGPDAIILVFFSHIEF